MKKCPSCKGLIDEKNDICPICGSETTVAPIETVKVKRTINSLQVTGRVFKDTLSLIVRNPQSLLLPLFLLLVFLAAVGLPVIMTRDPADLVRRGQAMMSLFDVRTLNPSELPTLFSQMAGGLSSFYPYYGLAVASLLIMINNAAWPLMASRYVSGQKVSLYNTLVDVVRPVSKVGQLSLTYVIYVSLVVITGWVLLAYFLYPAGDAFGTLAAQIAALLFLPLWGYITLRIWLVFPAQVIEQASSMESFGISVDATRTHRRSSYVSILAIAGITMLLRTTIAVSRGPSTSSTPLLAPVLLALITTVFIMALAGLVPSVYYLTVVLKRQIPRD